MKMISIKKNNAKSFAFFEAAVVVFVVALVSFLGFGYASNQQSVANQKATAAKANSDNKAEKPVEASEVPALANRTDVNTADEQLDDMERELNDSEDDKQVQSDLKSLEDNRGTDQSTSSNKSSIPGQEKRTLER